MNKTQYAGAMVGAIALAASIIGAGAPAGAHRAMGNVAGTASYTFTAIASPSDPAFTQLLGINKSGAIAGYFGSGADAQHPNKGFVLNLPSQFTSENFPNSAQTQVIGIDDRGDTDGFYIDAMGTTHGFTNIDGSFSTVDVPGTGLNQLLGLNNRGEQAGYYAFGPANSQTFVPFIHRADGTFTLLPIANAQATTINDREMVGGFSNDAAGNSHGFLWQSGAAPTSVGFQGAVSTQILGLNKVGQAVGSYTDGQKVAHGFVYDVNARAFTQVDVPGSTSTVVNGIAKNGTLVGFFTDARNNTIGFVAKPGTDGGNTGMTGMRTSTPTPTSTPATPMPISTATPSARFTSSTSLSASSTVTTVRIPVSFTVSVVPSQATGTVLLLDGGQQIATGTLRNGSVTFRSISLAGGIQQLTAEYLGDATFQPSISSAVSVRVNMSF